MPLEKLVEVRKMWPVFIFGTGRCGSTHIQRLITLSTYCWIWGEHEGFLQPLLESVGRFGQSERLERIVFDSSARNDEQLILEMVSGSERLSWLNRLDKDEFRAEIVGLIDRLFRFGMPKGWTQWGFKEIRYGLDNNAPAALLDLFPSATAIFTFREPRRTIESMIRAWGRPGLLEVESSTSGLVDTYRNCARIWKKSVEYFLNHRKHYNRKVYFVSEDKLSLPIETVLQTVGLPLRDKVPDGLEITNPGPKSWPGWARIKVDELFANDAVICSDLFKQACKESDVDFGGHYA